MLARSRNNQIEKIEWCGIPVVIDNATTELIHVPPADEDPEQELEFRVTQSTAELVAEDFERYRPTLELRAANWREAKERLLREKNALQDTEENQAGFSITESKYND